MTVPVHVTSRDNPLLVRLRKLAHDGDAYKRVGSPRQLWLEGEHLCSAWRGQGADAEVAVLTDFAWAQPALRALASAARKVVVVPVPLFAALSELASPAAIGYVVALPAAPAIVPDLASVVLDRLQDAGNVGSILRSAAAFGVRQVLALKGTAGLWSPKVVRAAMGAHFGLRLIEGLQEDELASLAVPLVATRSHGGADLSSALLPRPCAWVLGHEGQGVAASLLARCALQVRIPQPGGQESLNVAAAAAVCLYESARRV